ncbi:MAG: ABC transporter permease, partial [Billgrantia desiderata]
MSLHTLSLDRTGRPDRIHDLPPIEPSELAVARPLWQRLWDQSAVRKGMILLALVLLWELAARYQANPLLLPGASDTATALWQGL